VHARATGSCALAKAHARAHAWLRGDGARFDADVAWARACEGAGELPTTVVSTTVVRPRPDDEVDDLLSVLPADPLRVRARLSSLVAERPTDVAVRLAAIEAAAPAERATVVGAAVTALPKEPWIQLAAVRDPMTAQAFVQAVDGTLEAKIPRATAPILARAVDGAEGATLGVVAERLIGVCAIGAKDACLRGDDARALPRATFLLRTTSVLLKSGPLLSNADLVDPRVRLDVVLALVAAKQVPLATNVASPLRGAWAGPEASLARAAIAAAMKNCALAKSEGEKAKDLTDYADVLATVAKCG
jgi:hypothetical protein